MSEFNEICVLVTQELGCTETEASQTHHQRVIKELSLMFYESDEYLFDRKTTNLKEKVRKFVDKCLYGDRYQRQLLADLELELSEGC